MSQVAVLARIFGECREGRISPQLCCATSLMPRQLAAGYLTETISEYIDFSDNEELWKEAPNMTGFGLSIYEEGIETGILSRKEAFTIWQEACHRSCH